MNEKSATGMDGKRTVTHCSRTGMFAPKRLNCELHVKCKVMTEDGTSVREITALMMCPFSLWRAMEDGKRRRGDFCPSKAPVHFGELGSVRV